MPFVPGLPQPVAEFPALTPPPAVERFADVPEDGAGGDWTGECGAGEGSVGAADRIVRLLRVLDALDPAAAAQVRGGLPHGDSTVGIGLAFFLAATTRGARDWLGTAADGLDALDDGLLLDEVEEALRPRPRRTPDGRRWRVLQVPLLEGAGTRTLLCAVADEDGLQTETLLVLQVRLPALGAVQLQAAGTRHRLDVTLLTAEPPPPVLRTELQAAFAAALADVGMKGNLVVGPVIGAWLDLDEGLRADTTV